MRTAVVPIVHRVWVALLLVVLGASNLILLSSALHAYDGGPTALADSVDVQTQLGPDLPVRPGELQAGMDDHRYDDAANLARTVARPVSYRLAPNTPGAGALTSSQRAQYLFDNWHPATFPNRAQSIGYHLAKHGKGRSAFEYTRDAQQFFSQNRNLATPVTLKDGTAGLRIQTKVPGGGTNSIGGHWTSDGRLVTFWD